LLAIRYRLRTLLILLAVGPPLVGYLWPRAPRPVPIKTVREGETAEVDVIQVHTNPNFPQVLFWSRYPDGELHLRTWLLKGTRQNKSLQIKHWGGKYCECTWTEKGIQRRVLAPVFQETNSASDPEIDDRRRVPKTKRIPLWESRGAATMTGRLTTGR
jgi:hypothetical protein